MQHQAAEQLNIEMPLPERPFCRLADCCEGFGQNVVETLPGFQALPELIRLCRECSVVERQKLRLESVHRIDSLLQTLEYPLVFRAEEGFGECAEHADLLYENEYPESDRLADR